jgi:hypothetical protein
MYNGDGARWSCLCKFINTDTCVVVTSERISSIQDYTPEVVLTPPSKVLDAVFVLEVDDSYDFDDYSF